MSPLILHTKCTNSKTGSTTFGVPPVEESGAAVAARASVGGVVVDGRSMTATREAKHDRFYVVIRVFVDWFRSFVSF